MSATALLVALFGGLGSVLRFRGRPAARQVQLAMLERGEWGRADGYFAGTARACLVAGFAGLALGRALR